MTKSRTISEFLELNNNEQISELTKRLEEIKKDYKKFLKLLAYKHFESLTKEEKSDLLKSQSHNEMLKIGYDLLNDFTKLIPFMGQYQKI